MDFDSRILDPITYDIFEYMREKELHYAYAVRMNEQQGAPCMSVRLPCVAAAKPQSLSPAGCCTLDGCMVQHFERGSSLIALRHQAFPSDHCPL